MNIAHAQEFGERGRKPVTLHREERESEKHGEDAAGELIEERLPRSPRRVERARKEEYEPLRHEPDSKDGEKSRGKARRIPIERPGAEDDPHDMRAQDDNEPKSDERPEDDVPRA